MDIVGLSNLNSLLASIPPYWKSFFEDLARRIGDPRAKQAESDQIVSAMKAKNLPVTYVLYPDEARGVRPSRRR